MAATPVLNTLGVRLGERMGDGGREALPGRAEPEPNSGLADELFDHVIIAGFGRGGRGVARVLRDAEVPQIVATLSPEGASDAVGLGVPVLLGDPARARTLEEAGLDRARIVVIADDAAERVGHIARLVRTRRPDVTLIAHTRYAGDVAGLEHDGANWVVSEEVEGGAMLATGILKHYDIELADAVVRAHAVRGFYREQTAAPVAVRLPEQATVDTQATVTVSFADGACEHARQVVPVVPGTTGCEESLQSGDAWVHLRLCLNCGHVGCCDSSPNRHARAHHEQSDHHVVRSAEPGESWVYCFADDMKLKTREVPAPAG